MKTLIRSNPLQTPQTNIQNAKYAVLMPKYTLRFYEINAMIS